MFDEVCQCFSKSNGVNDEIKKICRDENQHNHGGGLHCPLGDFLEKGKVHSTVIAGKYERSQDSESSRFSGGSPAGVDGANDDNKNDKNWQDIFEAMQSFLPRAITSSTTELRFDETELRMVWGISVC